MIYFTSDTHFFHKNIIKYCNRPFYTDDSNEMDNAIISNWNSVVSPIDTVYHLGDFAFTGNTEKIRLTIQSLNGDIHLLMGNHDYQNKFNRDNVRSLFKSVNDYLYIEVDDEEQGLMQGIFLCHYPMLTWHNAMRGSWQLFGHIHSGINSSASEKDILLKPSQYDVGVDNNNFTPISYEQLKVIITRQYLHRKNI